MFEWDEAKRATNIEKHGLDFRDRVLMFDGRPIVSFPARTASQARPITIGRIDGKFYTLVWMQRGDARRIISFRRARHEEEQRHHTSYD